MSKRKLSAQEMPSHAEIQAKVEEIACLFAEEQAALASSLDEDEIDEDFDPDGDSYHPDTYPLLRILMSRLDGLKLPPADHPESDALYHSLQAFELAKAERPWDEELLLAALIHDLGLAIDRRQSVSACLNAVGHLLTERIRFLIEHRSDAVEYLRTGKVPKSLRRSEHFDDLVLLAQCDLKGRVPGAAVGTLDEALDYIAGLENSWDDV